MKEIYFSKSEFNKWYEIVFIISKQTYRMPMEISESEFGLDYIPLGNTFLGNIVMSFKFKITDEKKYIMFRLEHM